MPEQPTIESIQKEYEEFLYIVSHDFRAPLRHLKEFTLILIENLNKDINNDTQTCINFIQKSLTRIESMQEALLQLSRITTRANEHEKTDINKIIKNVISEIKSKNKNRHITIEEYNLPELIVEPQQFRMVFYHLIHNAQKYNEDAVIIKISTYMEDNHIVFCIEDNGIGIHSDHTQDIFTMFRRLHSPDDYGGGNGAGLTIVKKIIEHHGGNIWIDTSPQNGTKVLFKLPESLIA